MPPEKDQPQPSGISIQTLLISSLAAVAAAVIVPMFWERGSILATAITPIIVAIVSEALNRPAKVIKTTASQRVTRRTATGAAVRVEQPSGVGARGEGPERVSKWGDEDDPFGLRAPEPKRRRFPWKLAIVTGLLAAVIGAVTVTASELAIFGHSVGHSDRSTSVFGGSRSETPTPEATPTATEEATETATAEPTETATPEATETRHRHALGHGTVAPLPETPTATVPPTDTATPVPTP